MQNTIIWFRNDLRLTDNAALFHAAKNGPVIALYILEDHIGSASKYWLHHSLKSLEAELKKHHIQLIIDCGDSQKIIERVLDESKAEAVYWNHSFEPELLARDNSIKSSLEKNGIEVKTFNASLLCEPWKILNQQQNYFKIFTPFWKHFLKFHEVEPALPKPENLQPIAVKILSKKIEDLNLLPKNPNWAQKFDGLWNIGELAAQEKLSEFLNKNISNYSLGRDFPIKDSTSHLSPHLHFGEISPRQIWHGLKQYELSKNDGENSAKFLSELGWREFSYYLHYHFPNITNKPFKNEFTEFLWQKDEADLSAWQNGNTGYPIVDAGMRELYATGYMHNRVRMIVASFLTKHLLIDWREGAKWFLDTLVDADASNNATSWQWVAGCGSDATPYFRIFNPILQGQKFDIDGEYVKLWIPELKNLDKKYIHTPWQADAETLKKAQITLGETYPKPVINHDFARKRALEIYKESMRRHRVN